MSAPADGFARDAMSDDGGGLPHRRHLPVVQTQVPAAKVVAPYKPRTPRPKRTTARAKTLSMRRASKRVAAATALLYPREEFAHVQRPKHRADCAGHEGPCPWVACKFHLYLTVNEDNGNIKLHFPDLESWELPETCALDVADRGGVTLEEVAAAGNCTRERVRQIETVALAKLKASRAASNLADYMNDDPEPALMRGRALNIRNAIPMAEPIAARGDIWKGGHR